MSNYLHNLIARTTQENVDMLQPRLPGLYEPAAPQAPLSEVALSTVGEETDPGHDQRVETTANVVVSSSSAQRPQHEQDPPQLIRPSLETTPGPAVDQLATPTHSVWPNDGAGQTASQPLQSATHPAKAGLEYGPSLPLKPGATVPDSLPARAPISQPALLAQDTPPTVPAPAAQILPEMSAQIADKPPLTPAIVPTIVAPGPEATGTPEPLMPPDPAPKLQPGAARATQPELPQLVEVKAPALAEKAGPQIVAVPGSRASTSAQRDPNLGSPVLPSLSRDQSRSRRLPANPEPTIEVHIGRIEVRAAPAATPAAKQERSRPLVMSLDEYLSQHNGQGGQR